jgi:hypothetical protein
VSTACRSQVPIPMMSAPFPTGTYAASIAGRRPRTYRLRYLEVSERGDPPPVRVGDPPRAVHPKSAGGTGATAWQEDPAPPDPRATGTTRIGRGDRQRAATPPVDLHHPAGNRDARG